ncbi:FecCD family ABC transporter permease [Egicoccus sp. AB-alg6-2]|uniref:FecCD family ABC transporter permease n=1 Tax=Egicoccus sp. AB-alg6-2 TaxID=3242692 RepID=UPI00359DAE3B
MSATSLPRSPTSGTDPVARIVAARAATRRRLLAVTMALAIAVVLAFWTGLALGDVVASNADVWAALFGSGEGGVVNVVRNIRLPRAVAAIVVGAGLGLSGAIFQSLTRNPLASPDILGVTAGASTAAVFAIVWLSAPGTRVAIWAVLGALVAVLAIYGLAWRNGLSIYRLVLVGVGIGAVCQALTEYLITTAATTTAVSATTWLTGSLNSISWLRVGPAVPVLVLLLLALRRLAAALGAIELGDETARGLGVKLEPAKLLLVLIAVALAGVAVSVAGPVVFVAFVAPPIARRLTHGGVALIPCALVGVLLVQAADLVGHHALARAELPVGVITGIIGAPYLLYLLARANQLGQTG